MKNFSILVLLFLFTGLSAQVEVNNGSWGRSGPRVKGDGNVVTKDRDETGFTGIHVCCSMKVEISEATKFSVRVEAESNLQEFVKTEVSVRTLKVGYTSEANFKSTEPIRVYISLPKLEALKTTSSSTVVGQNTFHGDELEVESTSSSNATLVFEGNRVMARATSSADLEISGRAADIKAEASSSAKIDARRLESRDGQASVSSSADVILKVSQSLRATASSSGTVIYYGKPGDVDSSSSSSGSVRGKD